MKPRIGNCYGMSVHPIFGAGNTWIEGEMWNTDYGQFRRRGRVLHSKTNKIVSVRLDVADTYFSIPATTVTEHGYVTTNDQGVLEFRPHVHQDQTPKEFRKLTKRHFK